MSFVLCSGSRHMPATAKYVIREMFALLPKDTIIVEGGAEGADKLAGEVAEEFGFRVIVENADWKELGRAAGRERNQRMLSKYNPNLAFFFHHSPTLGSGTLDMYTRCRKAGVPSRVKLYDAAEAYIRWVLESEDPHAHSVADPEFKALSEKEQAKVMAKFDGYGLRDALAATAKDPLDGK